jgi:hypothetical protein
MVKSKDSIGAFGRDDGYSILPGRSFEAFDDSPFEKHTLDRILHCKLSERRRHGAVTSWDAIFPLCSGCEPYMRISPERNTKLSCTAHKI